MSWYAVESLDRAVYATRRFLFPFGAVRWAKLAFLALLMVGGGASLSGAGTTSIGASVAESVSASGSGRWSEVVPAGTESVSGDVEPVLGAAAERLIGLDAALLAAGAVGVVLVTALLTACSIALRLVFYDALSTTEVALRRPFRDRFRQALGLFTFAATVAVVTGLPAVGFAFALDPGVPRLLGVSPDGFFGTSTVPTGVLSVLGVMATAAALVGVLAFRLTLEFVAPAMVARDLGVLAGWRAVWEAFRGSWDDVVLYVALHAVVAGGVRILQAVAVAFVGGIVAVTALVVLVLTAIPLGGVGALVGTTAGAVALVIVLACAAVAVVAVTLPLRLLLRTYLTAYEVSTLAGIAPDLTLLAPTLVASDESGLVGG